MINIQWKSTQRVHFLVICHPVKPPQIIHETPVLPFFSTHYLSKKKKMLSQDCTKPSLVQSCESFAVLLYEAFSLRGIRLAQCCRNFWHVCKAFYIFIKSLLMAASCLLRRNKEKFCDLLFSDYVKFIEAALF